MDKRHDRAHDQVPVRIEPEGHDGLEIQRVTPAVTGAQVEVEVVLKRHTDQRGHRVRQLFDQFLVAPLRSPRRRLGRGHRHRTQHAKKSGVTSHGQLVSCRAK
jgi:hypothetical protein